MERYILFGLRHVGGWLHSYTAEFLAAISDVQRRSGYHGAVGEIGVHHGKLFILLNLLAFTDEPAFAIDVFEDQALNVDQSGQGDRAIFLGNLARWGKSADGVKIIAKSSLEVTPPEILDACGQVRLASIDGGHTAECTYSDLKLIDAVIHDYGVVALDDYFNEDWPDVSTGTAQYMLEDGTRLRPFAVTPNKLFLSTKEHNGFYRDMPAQKTPFRKYKTSDMFGSPVDVFHGPQPAPPLRRYLREVVRSSFAGPYLLAAKSAMNRRSS